MEAAQRRPAGEPPPPLAHLPLQLPAELRLLRHSCAVIAQITPRPPCAPPSRVGAAPLDTKPSQTCTFLNKYLILKRRCGGTDALKPDRGPGLSSPPRSARSSRERSSSSEETSRHASGSVHSSSSSLTAAPLASSGGNLGFVDVCGNAPPPKSEAQSAFRWDGDTPPTDLCPVTTSTLTCFVECNHPWTFDVGGRPQSQICRPPLAP